MKHLFAVVLMLGAGGLVACFSDKSDSGGSALAGSGGGAGQSGDGATGRPDCLPNLPIACVQDMCEKENFNCGDPASVFDEFGCYRAKCSTSAECEAGEQCREVTYAPPSCGFDPNNDQVCSCGTWLSIMTEMRCFPAL